MENKQDISDQARIQQSGPPEVVNADAVNVPHEQAKDWRTKIGSLLRSGLHVLPWTRGKPSEQLPLEIAEMSEEERKNFDVFLEGLRCVSEQKMQQVPNKERSLYIKRMQDEGYIIDEKFSFLDRGGSAHFITCARPYMPSPSQYQALLPLYQRFHECPRVFAILQQLDVFLTVESIHSDEAIVRMLLSSNKLPALLSSLQNVHVVSAATHSSLDAKKYLEQLCTLAQNCEPIDAGLAANVQRIIEHLQLSSISEHWAAQ
jgi:hypothetical protein